MSENNAVYLTSKSQELNLHAREELTVRVHCCEGRPPVEFIRLSPTKGSSYSQRVSEQVTRPQGGTSTWCVRHGGGGRQERERNSNSTPSYSPSASSLPPATLGFREIAISRNHELAITGWDLLDCEVGHRLHTGARPRNRYNERCNALNVPTGRCACVVLSVHSYRNVPSSMPTCCLTSCERAPVVSSVNKRASGSQQRH
ncbi:hypothetical protein C0Q70_05196 [Pomacea canaliculata]|uniref:Uncharacterized protein n=1 Tax=Pomacea canaliculata TaxID=400727 RepID=A0A2T7PKK5_POMCA|nr:hypothetical protein C0Q70_05196 [Pomacea canaliculata]